MEDRYTVEMSLFIWAKDDEEAKRIALEIQQRQRDKFDNRCHITKLSETPFGRIRDREVKIEGNY